jgi:hypothetical protein
MHIVGFIIGVSQQGPQSSLPPQPSSTEPQRPAQALLVQPHTPLCPPPPQVWYAGRPWLAQVQRKVPPQPFEKSPHWFGYAAHVKSVGQLHVPGVFAVVELHTVPAPVQPQSSVPPQPSSSFEPHLPA